MMGRRDWPPAPGWLSTFYAVTTYAAIGGSFGETHGRAVPTTRGFRFFRESPAEVSESYSAISGDRRESVDLVAVMLPAGTPFASDQFKFRAGAVCLDHFVKLLRFAGVFAAISGQQS